MSKKYTIEEYSPKVLLATACEHLRAALKLRDDPFSLFSAGFLCHLCIELTLKGWWLYEQKVFKDYHDLCKIYEEIESLTFNKAEIELLEELNKLQYLRYPIKKEHWKKIDPESLSCQYGEVGTDSIDSTWALLMVIKSKMPPELSSNYEEDDIKRLIPID